MPEVDNAAAAMEQRCRALAEELRDPGSSPAAVACASHTKVCDGLATLLECQAIRLADARAERLDTAHIVKTEAIKTVISAVIAAVLILLGFKSYLASDIKSLATKVEQIQQVQQK